MIKAIKNSHSDIIISTRIYLNKLLGKYGHTYKIGWEHNHHHGDTVYIKKFSDSFKKLDKVVLVSSTLNRFYSDLFIKKKIKCECVFIPNFITEWPKTNNKLNNNNLISVGRLSKEKGFIDLINVYKIINMNFNDTFLNVVGDGIEKETMENNIIKDNLALKVKIHGYQNKEYINNLYANSSLYLMCSKTESFGLVLVEAMSYGIPCIAFDSAEGAKELIQNNYNGFLIKNRNEHEMADCVVKLLSDRKLLKKLGLNARKTALKYLNANVYLDWNKILGG